MQVCILCVAFLCVVDGRKSVQFHVRVWLLKTQIQYLTVMYPRSNSFAYISSCKHSHTRYDNPSCGLMLTCILNIYRVVHVYNHQRRSRETQLNTCERLWSNHLYHHSKTPTVEKNPVFSCSRVSESLRVCDKEH